MFKVFKKYPDLVVAFSDRKDGPMKFSPENRKRFFKKIGVAEESTVKAGLAHKDKLETVSPEDAGKLIENTDGLTTKNSNLFLTITVADCLPVFIYNPKKEIIALVHAGWRGLASGILENAIKKTGKDVAVGIGPGISRCHFEVKEDVLNYFKPWLKQAQKGSFLDLKKIAELQLMNLGVREKNIEINPDCTYCLKNKYFSHRREQTENLKTMLAVFGKRC